MTGVTQDAQIEKIKLLSIAFETVIRGSHIHLEWKTDLIPHYVISVKGITNSSWNISWFNVISWRSFVNDIMMWLI